MSSRIPVLCTLLLGGALTGCFSFLHPWATDRTVDGTYDQVFQATLETLEAREFPIEEVDREAGKIVTGKRPVSGVGMSHPVETVRAYVEQEGEESVSVRLFLTFLDPAPSTREPTAGSRGNRTQNEGAGVVNKSVVYDDYLDAIEERVNGYRTSPDLRARDDSLDD